MSAERESFIASILDDPDDDTPRMAYADWLDEHEAMLPCPRPTCGKSARGYDGFHRCLACRGNGQVSNGFGERAESIRVQCELARLDAIDRLRARDGLDPSPKLMRDEETLRGREYELLFQQRPEWFPIPAGWVTSLWETPPSPLHNVMLLRRGFVESVSCTWAGCCDHLDEVLKVQPVRRVVLTTWPRWNTAIAGRTSLEGRSKDHWIPQGENLDHSRGGIADMLLRAEWPGVGFDLPPVAAGSVLTP